MPVAPLWAQVCGLIGAVLLVLPLPWRARALALPLILPLLLPPRDLPAHGAFDLLALDVGQGSSVLVRTSTHLLVFDEATHRIIGGGIVGVHAGELIAEIGLAIEMGCEVEDIGHTIHPHPTLSESVGMAAEVFDGTITDLYIPKKK